MDCVDPFTSSVPLRTCSQKWWYFVAMCFVLGLFWGNFANFSIPLLYSKRVHLICSLAPGFFRMSFNSKINSLRGRTFLATVDNTMYSASVLLIAIFVCSLLNHVIGHPVYLITHHVLDFTELEFTHTS